MRHFITTAALLVATAFPATAQVSVDFEKANGGCFIDAQPLASPLVAQYSAQGVTFSGNGWLFNECAGFEVFHAHSGTDYAGYVGFGGHSRFESITFSSVQSYFEIYVGGSSFPTFTYFLGGNVVGSSSLSLDSFRWTQVAYTGAYDRVDIRGVSQLDDLTTQSLATPEPASVLLLATGLVGIAALVRRRPARVD